jgi:putative membrane protein
VIEVFAGVAAGFVAGLLPGMHANTFLPFLAFSGSAGFIIGLAVSYSFFDFLKGVFVGVPDDSSGLSVLPAHRLVMQGRALEAFRLTIAGGLFSGMLALLVFPAALLFLSLYDSVKFLVPLALIATLALMVLGSRRKALALLFIVVSGVLGFVALDRPYSLAAIFAGFFGVSSVLASLWTRPVIPPQRRNARVRLGPRRVFFGALAGYFSGLLPGVSSSVSSLVAKHVGGLDSARSFLAVNSGANTAYAIVAVLAIWIIGTPRSGAGLSVEALSPDLVKVLGFVIVALAASAGFAWWLSSRAVRVYDVVDFRLLNICALVLVSAAVFAAGGVGALFLMAVCSMLGFACQGLGVARSSLMGVLMVPALGFYLGF